MTLLISRLYVRSNLYRNEVFGVTRSMFSNQLEMIFERGFPLIRRINEIIAAMRDMGMMSKLFNDFNYNMTILTSIRELKEQISHSESTDDVDINLNAEENHDLVRDENPEIVLTTEHLEGAFTILIMCLIVSSAVFLLEIVSDLKIVRKILKILWRKVRCAT